MTLLSTCWQTGRDGKLYFARIIGYFQKSLSIRLTVQFLEGPQDGEIFYVNEVEAK